MRVLARALIVTAGAGLMYLAVGVAAARYAVLGRQRKLRILGRPSVDVIRLPPINATESPVTFGLQDERRALHVVGSVVGVGDGYVDRVIGADSPLKPGQHVQLVGNVFGPETELARSAVSIRADVAGVVHQVWDFDPVGADRGMRFIHVHGLGAAPATTLRSVDAVQRLGFPSTVVSLDGHADMTRRVNGIRSTAGARVTWALDHARTTGAERVILVGWSFGAQLVVERTLDRVEVSGLVLISPTTDLLRTVRREAKARGIPRAVAAAAQFVLSTGCLSRLALVDAPFSRRADEVNGGLVRHVLWLSSGDDETLIAINAATKVEGSGADYTVVEFVKAPHTMEWNTDPELFTASIATWLQKIGGEPDA